MRLIDADALIEGLLVNPEECPGCPEPEWIEDFINTVDAAPTIEFPTHNEGSQCTQNVEDEIDTLNGRICELELINDELEHQHKSLLQQMEGLKGEIRGLKFAIRCNGVSGGEVAQ